MLFIIPSLTPMENLVVIKLLHLLNTLNPSLTLTKLLLIFQSSIGFLLQRACFCHFFKKMNNSGVNSPQALIPDSTAVFVVIYNIYIIAHFPLFFRSFLLFSQAFTFIFDVCCGVDATDVMCATIRASPFANSQVLEALRTCLFSTIRANLR